MALLAQHVEAGANDTEIIGAFDGADAARNLLFYLGHAHCTFGHVVSCRDPQRALAAGAADGAGAGATGAQRLETVRQTQSGR